MIGRLQLRFAGADAPALAALALAEGFIHLNHTSESMVENHDVPLTEPIPALLGKVGDLAVWSEGHMLDFTRRHDKLMLLRKNVSIHPEEVLARIAHWPFEFAVAENPTPAWWPKETINGWMFAFKGRGHRFVSERILDRGPWRILRRGDVTLVQLYDLEGDATSTLEQARPCHALLAPCWRGGHFYSWNWAFRSSLYAWKPSAYDPATRTSIKVVPFGEALTRQEMGTAAGTLVHQPYAEPVDAVAIVYLDEATAWRQLPELWTFGLQVRAITATGERRIDEDYIPPPPPPPPAWVQRLG